MATTPVHDPYTYTDRGNFRKIDMRARVSIAEIAQLHLPPAADRGACMCAHLINNGLFWSTALESVTREVFELGLEPNECIQTIQGAIELLIMEGIVHEEEVEEYQSFAGSDY